MVKYLKNTICNFTPLFDINYENEINIISASFFKIAGKGYKDFSKYSNGIKYITTYIKNELPDFRLRLFIDNSIYNDKELMKKLKRDKLIQLVLYDCPNYKRGDTHRGLFGTLIRFFPMFNFKNNDAKIVLICDIDITCNNHIQHLLGTFTSIYKSPNFNKITEDILFLDCTVLIRGETYDNICYDRKYIIPHIQASRIYVFNKLNKSIILKYINELTLNDVNYKNLIHSTKSEIIHAFKSPFIYNKNPVNNVKHLINVSADNKYIYGIDEYFLNINYINYIKKKNLSFGVKIEYTIIDNILGWINELDWNPSKYITNIYQNFFKSIFNESKDMTLKEYAKLLKKLNIQNKKLTKESIALLTKVYILYIRIYNTKYIKYFNKTFIEIILSNEYIGIVFLQKYKYYNSKSKDKVLKIVKLPTKNINKIKAYLNKSISK